MSRLFDIGKIVRMNDLNGDLLLGELEARSAVEERISGIVKKAEDRMKDMMFKIGDFDPRHYTVNYSNSFNDTENSRFEMVAEIKYAATEKQRKKALRMLKTMYGKRFFEEKAHLLHPAMFMLTENVDF